MKVKYRCGACNQQFSRNYAPLLCPFCGKETVAEDKMIAADDLLREVSGY